MELLLVLALEGFNVRDRIPLNLCPFYRNIATGEVRVCVVLAVPLGEGGVSEYLIPLSIPPRLHVHFVSVRRAK